MRRMSISMLHHDSLRAAGCGRLAPVLLVGVVALALTGCSAPQAPLEPTVVVVDLPDYQQFVDQTLSRLRKYELTPERVDRSRGLIETQRITGKQWFEFWRRDAQGSYQAFESSLHTIGRVITIRIEPETAAAAAFPATRRAHPHAQSGMSTDSDPPMFMAQPGSASTGAAARGSASDDANTLVVEPRDVGGAAPVALPAAVPPAAAEPGGDALDHIAARGADDFFAPPVYPQSGRFRVGVNVEKSRYSAPDRQVTTASGALAIYSERLPTTEGLRRSASRTAHWVPLGRDGLMESYLLNKLTEDLGEAAPESGSPTTTTTAN